MTEQLVPKNTNATSPFVITATSQGSIINDANGWTTSDGNYTNGQWIDHEMPRVTWNFGTAKTISRATIFGQWGNSGVFAWAGSNDGSTWTVLTTTAVPATLGLSSNASQEITFTTPTAYQYIRFNHNLSTGGEDGKLNEIDLYELIEEAPEPETVERYYFCKVINTQSGTASEPVYSRIATVSYSSDITAALSVDVLNADAISTADGVLTYQWYETTSADMTDGTASASAIAAATPLTGTDGSVLDGETVLYDYTGSDTDTLNLTFYVSGGESEPSGAPAALVSNVWYSTSSATATTQGKATTNNGIIDESYTSGTRYMVWTAGNDTDTFEVLYYTNGDKRSPIPPTVTLSNQGIGAAVKGSGSQWSASINFGNVQYSTDSFATWFVISTGTDGSKEYYRFLFDSR